MPERRPRVRHGGQCHHIQPKKRSIVILRYRTRECFPERRCRRGGVLDLRVIVRDESEAESGDVNQYGTDRQDQAGYAVIEPAYEVTFHER